MLNAFPQSGATSKALLLTYDQALTGVTDQAISDTAARFIRGDVPEQSGTFAPSVAEFVKQARFQGSLLPSLPSSQKKGRYRYTTPKSKVVERNLTKEYGRQLVDHGVHPRGCIWLPGDFFDRPDIGDLFGPDPDWPLPVMVAS